MSTKRDLSAQSSGDSYWRTREGRIEQAVRAGLRDAGVQGPLVALVGPVMRHLLAELASSPTPQNYGCARRGCDVVNAAWESYGAYGKGWCLGHVPLRIRIRRALGQDV